MKSEDYTSLGLTRLEDYSLLTPIFGDVPITPNWKYALDNGLTKLYNDYGILNVCFDGDICVMNSGTIANGRFPASMIKDMMRISDTQSRCIIYSERHEIKRYMEKIGYRHDPEKNLYIKGL